MPGAPQATGLLKKLVLNRTVGAVLCGCPVFTANLKAGTETCPYIIRFFNSPGYCGAPFFEINQRFRHSRERVC